MADDVPSTSEPFELLAVGGDLPPALCSSLADAVINVVQSNNIATLVQSKWDAVVFSAPPAAAAGPSELWVMDAALRLVQTQATYVDAAPPPVWLCTTATQPVTTHSSSTPRNAGLWGLARTSRQERATLPTWCVDVPNDAARGLAKVVRQHTLRLPSGSVRGLNLSTSVEPEAALHTANLLVPRLVAPYDTRPTVLDIEFTAVRRLLGAHTTDAMAKLDMEELLVTYSKLEALNQQYLHEAVASVPVSKVPVWHHKLLYAWCATQYPPPPGEAVAVAPADVLAAHGALWAELQLSERVGPRFGDALNGDVPEVTYVELLFPGGSFELVLPFYERAITSSFYNKCVVAAVQAVLTQLPAERCVVALEVGAGTGGTASSVLPILGSMCEKYIFTDVSETFLRKARVRFADFPFLEYMLLNIDADPRFQGLATHQCDAIVATNVLHATPFMRNTLRNCERLLRAGGVLIANDGLYTSAFAQMTFGMTDGWWLFAECQDPERVGQGSPLLSWRQWQAILVDVGFREVHCMRGNTFLAGMAAIVAQTAMPEESSHATRVALGE